MSQLIEVKELSVAFGSADPVVDKVSFSIAKGETVALVGESGSGKSVSALSILKLHKYPFTKHQSGEIWFKGDNLLEYSEKKIRKIRGDRVSMIFQEPMTSLNPLFTIGYQVQEALQTHNNISSLEAKKRVIELLETVGIKNPESRYGSYPHQLSGGQRQRVMIAMAIINKPDLLIADEPTTALDVTVQAQVLKLLKDLQQLMGMGVLMISHDLAVVKNIADRVYVMKDGKVVEQGFCNEIFNNPCHEYTKKLIEAEPTGSPQQITSENEVFSVSNISVKYPSEDSLFNEKFILAVDGISFSLKEGETLGVVGESGSGKTTLGRAVLRLIESSGNISYKGINLRSKDSEELRKIRQHLQVVFQDPYGSLSPRRKINKIIEEGLVAHHPNMSQKERDVLVVKSMKEVELLPELRFRYPHQLSGGQRQRVAIARAIILNPDVIIFDEPTSALDMTIQVQIVELIKKLQSKHNLACLFISHDLKVVRALSHNIIVMKDGAVVESGATEDIFLTPKMDYTKTLIETSYSVTQYN